MPRKGMGSYYLTETESQCGKMIKFWRVRITNHLHGNVNIFDAIELEV